jgi:hypothetical protein
MLFSGSKGANKMRSDTLCLFADDGLESDASPEAAVESVLGGINELGEYSGKRPIQCFTMKMPFPLFLQLKKLSQKAKSLAPDEKKDFYTMTACVNSLVEKVGIPALKQLVDELEKRHSSGNAA